MDLERKKIFSQFFFSIFSQKSDFLKKITTFQASTLIDLAIIVFFFLNFYACPNYVSDSS